MTTGAPSRHPSVRILVVGDSGVGKTALVHLLCHGVPMRNPTWTVGCNAECKLHEYSGTQQVGSSTFFVDFWDVSGTGKYHELARAVFFHHLNGVVFVHDLTNRKSFKNLLKWGREILRAQQDFAEQTYSPGGTIHRRSSNIGAGAEALRERALPIPLLGTVPVVVIGNKADLPVSFESTVETQQRRTHRLIMEELGVSTNDFLQASATTGVFDHVHMDAFFNRAIDHKMGTMASGILKPAKTVPAGYSRRTSANTSGMMRSPANPIPSNRYPTVETMERLAEDFNLRE